MTKPEMILFDYGQTLIDEQGFDGVRGTAAVMKYAVKNKYNKTPAEIQAFADQLNREIGRYDPDKRHLFQYELPNYMFSAFLYESQGIEIALKPEEIDTIFWDAAAPGKITEGLNEFLGFLRESGIRTAVLSNISFSGEAVKLRIKECIPDHEFEFIIATSEYLYRKPNRHIFDLALEKADLKAEAIWYVGDQYKCDVVGARNAGMFPVWYTGAMDFKQEADEPVLTIENWQELKELIERNT